MASKTPTGVRLPPGCGQDLDVPLLYNPYQQKFMEARRLRFCLKCNKQGTMDENCVFVCPSCGTNHTSNLTAPRMFDRFLILSGRGGGKTLIGAHAAREEMLVPNSIGWVMGANHKWLHDSTFPTLIRLIPPEWVARWDSEHMELRLKNGALVAFRSLEDPDRARGPHGVNWGWFDEAAQCPERAYDVFTPTLIKAGGIVICTTTVLGYDWTYERIEKEAVKGEPGFWAIRYWSEENPLFQSNPVMMREIERNKKTMDPDFYAQEYKAERRNATGLIFPFKIIEEQSLDDEQMKRLIPEWPEINPDRKVIVGLDSGVDHPFGAVLIVVTDQGLVVVADYLERQQAVSQHLAPISLQFGLHRWSEVQKTFAANKNEANLRLEWGLKGVGISPAENKHEVGNQRVNSWLYSRQLFFAKNRVPRTIDQMKAYRHANNTSLDGQKKPEQVFKKNDELPDAVRYALMVFPELPDPEKAPLSPRQQSRWDQLSDDAKLDIERVRDFQKRQSKEGNDMTEDEPTYPVGEFWGTDVGDDAEGFGW